MRRAMYGWGGVVALMALLGLAPQGAHADMPPPDGTRTQYHNVKIDLGAYAEVLPRQHKVAPGDTAGIDQTLQSFDTLLVDLSEPVVAGVQQAFDVLSFGLTRGLTTGQWSAWSNASLEDAESALARLRDSSIGLLNAIYAAVARLIISAWYLIPENAATTGYPGPPKKEAGVIPAAAPAEEATQ